jgi:hypothetical protein
MYAQCQSVADYQAMQQDPVSRLFFEEALSMPKFEPVMYEVARTFSPVGT